MTPHTENESRIRTIGRDLYAATRVPRLFDSRTWLGSIMDRAIKSEDFKISLFRFIDVLPSLKNDEFVVKLLHEYFPGRTEVPGKISRAISWVPETGMIAHVAGPVIRRAVASLARQFIAGAKTDEIINALRSIKAGGNLFSIDLLGEIVLSDAEAQKYAAQCRGLLELLRRAVPEDDRPDISIKLSSFYSQLDPVDWPGSLERTKEGVRPLLRRAKELGVSVTFDMEPYYYKGLIIAVFKSLLEEEEFAELPRAGIALQTYLKDTKQDVSGLIGWAGRRKRRIGIRLVKGAYWDYEVVINRRQGWPVPVFLNKEETDRSFEQLTRLLLENTDFVYPMIASHNFRSVANAIALSELLRIPQHSFEFQMLYGMAAPLNKALRDRGYDVRLYTPVGELIAGMAYLVRRLLENTSNVSFLRRSLSAKVPFDELIKAPIPGAENSTRKKITGFRNEPVLDFSREENRKKMQEAISTAKKTPGGTYPLLIGGRTVRTEKEIISRNPARPEEIVGRTCAAGKKEADQAIAEALEAREAWRRTPAEKRAGYLFEAAEEMRRRRAELAALEVIEAGKTWKDADGDVAEAIDYLEYYGREMARVGKPQLLGDYAGEENEYMYVPRGLGVVIAPWNFPLAIATGMTSAAIVTGNCVLFKPSGFSPVIGYNLCDIFRAAGLPPGVLQFLPGRGADVGEYLVVHPSVDFIAFTGSKDVGLRIVRLAAETGKGQRNVKKVIAEMGGKNAIIVDETAELDEAVKGIVESAFGYQGQKCSACSRLIVVGDVYAELCGRLADAIASLRIGPPEEPGNSIGPVIDESALKKIRGYIETGKQEAELMLEREVVRDGYFVGPTVFTGAKPHSRIATEEIFGPVLTIMRARNLDHAISLANESEYALTGGLFSRSPANIRKVKEQFLAGNLYINRKITGALVGRQPFGGFALSGVGSKAGGPDYLLQFMNPVSISENTIRRGFAPFENA